MHHHAPYCITHIGAPFELQTCWVTEATLATKKTWKFAAPFQRAALPIRAGHFELPWSLWIEFNAPDFKVAAFIDSNELVSKMLQNPLKNTLPYMEGMEFPNISRKPLWSQTGGVNWCLHDENQLFET